MMKRRRFTETQIMQILKQAEGGEPVAHLCREHGQSDQKKTMALKRDFLHLPVLSQPGTYC